MKIQPTDYENPHSLGSIISGFKSAVSRRAKQRLWQRNYYDRIIRDEEELNRIRDYIIYNPIILSQSRETEWNANLPQT
jgi:REP element-mobilizing transposase RayT